MNVNGRKLCPRIILMTDGKPTDENGRETQQVRTFILIANCKSAVIACLVYPNGEDRQEPSLFPGMLVYHISHTRARLAPF